MPETSSSEYARRWLSELSHTPRDDYEVLSLVVHALLLGHGFRPSGSESDSESKRLPADWGVGGYGGKYQHARSSLSFEVRATPLGQRLRITAIHDSGDDAHTLDLPLARFVGEGDSVLSRINAFTDLATLVQINIAHKLVPDAAKEGYEAGSSSSSASAGTNNASSSERTGGAMRIPPVAPYPEHDPLRIGPIRPGMGGVGVPYPNVPAGGFGSDDLLPPGLARNPHGGNLMGPRNFPFPNRPRMPHGRLPPGAVPPGARYDPMGPGGIGPDNDIERPPQGDHPPLGDGPPPDMYW